MKYSFHPEAEAEFNQAIVYYEERENSLGYDSAQGPCRIGIQDRADMSIE